MVVMFGMKALGASVRIFEILDRNSEVTDGNLEPLVFEGGEFYKFIWIYSPELGG